MTTKFRLGVCGLGVIAQYYLKALPASPRFELAAVCDTNPAKVTGFARRGARVFADFRDLAASPDVDAVVINLPNDLHHPAARAALLGGKHVCCEKPLTLRAADAEDLRRVATLTGRTLLTAFHRRYNANVLAALAAARGRRIVRATAHYLEKIEEHAGADSWYLNPARSGGGCIADNGPNAFDTLARFLGPLAVTGATIERTRGGVDVGARVHLRAVDGTPAEVVLDWAYPHGERKELTVEYADGTALTADMLAGFPGFKSSLGHEYEAILADFAAQIDAGGCAGEDGLAAVRLVEDAYAAAARPVAAAHGEGRT